MNKKVLTFIFTITLTIIVGALSVVTRPLTPVLAQAEEVDPTDPAIQNIKEKYLNKDKIDKVLGDISTQRRGFVGQVSRVSETTFTLNVNGITRIVPFDENVQLIKNNQPIKAESVSVDDWALVLGFLEDDSINPKKIEISSGSPLPKPIFVGLGSLKNIKSKSIDFQPRTGEQIETVIINNQTKIEDYEGEETAFAQLIEEDQVLIVGYKNDDDTYATTIRALAPLAKE